MSSKTQERKSVLAKLIEDVERKIEKMKSVFDEIILWTCARDETATSIHNVYKKSRNNQVTFIAIVVPQVTLNNKDFLYSVKKRLKEKTERSDNKLLRG